MRIRDITAPGYYARRPRTDEDTKTRGRFVLHAVHMIGIMPVFIVGLARFCFVPLMDAGDGHPRIPEPDVLFEDDDDWSFLCDGSEPDFGSHTFLMKLMQLAGYNEDEARRIARDRLVESLDRQIYGSATAAKANGRGTNG